ncbi:gamma-glutamylcyclotransferase [Pseudoprimorskyibacter insulae]|uniref:ADP-ribose pyrophosphatase n=1 Tax=Pseudoprimorskyibacter insulae TaxID=1695997 RepID=A0A2R8AW79_9RHOB|nr:gamma-glutamylcyclotransferase [Pseudoprimorskyibacter insulae]SPF80295.1 ADP-ribose pyrophosphatase [Pseudoprimorskyibacter insulae]
MTDLFLFGTLRCVPLLEAVLGRALGADDLRAAQFPGHRAAPVNGADFPALVPDAGAAAQGLLVTVSDEDLARLDYYEGGYDYVLTPCTVVLDGQEVPAQVYVPGKPLQTGPGIWDLDDWIARRGDLTVLAAQDILRQYGRMPVAQIRALRNPLMARAWSRVLARQSDPHSLRRSALADHVTVTDRGTGHDGFFRLKEFDVSFRRFDGRETDPVHREIFIGYDAALVLPYDPRTDRLLLVEQLRMGVMGRGDPHPWVLEPVAGMVDAGESPEVCAHREAMEESGIAMTRLEKIGGVYASPGYATDYFHCFLGLCDLPEEGNWLGGLETETEDIRTHVISFNRAMDLLETGEINVAPLAMMVLWLARHRDRLRASA